MSHTAKKFSISMLCINLLCFMPVSFAASYNFVTLEVPNSTPGTTEARAINNNGQVVGSFRDDRGTHGFLYSEGKYTLLDDLNGTNGSILTQTFIHPEGINDNGQVVGYFENAVQLGSFIYDNGSFKTVPVPNVVKMPYVVTEYLKGINDSGQLVGFVNATIRAEVGYFANNLVLDNGIVHDFPPPSNEPTKLGSPLGINASGQVVSIYGSENKYWRGYIYNGNSYTKLNLPNALEENVFVQGINDKGQVIGTIMNSDGNNQVFIHDGTTFTILDLPTDKSNLFAHGINAKGQVVGTYGEFNKSSGFIATPIDMINTTCPPVNASFNIWSHDVILRDALFNGQHYWAKLADQGSYQFKLIDVHTIAASMCKDNEVLHFQDHILTIPNVSIYGVNSQVTLEQVGTEFQFRVKNVSQN